MASPYTAVLLLDTSPEGPEHRLRLRLASLRLLNYLGCRLGPGRVRWGSRCFDSQGPHGRPSRLCRFRELDPRGLEELEEELEARGHREPPRSTRTHPPPPASLTHTALKETLLDYQWDRPDITSPAKPALLRGRRGPLQESLQLQGLGAPRARNAIFLLAPCPHSRGQLSRFMSGREEGLQEGDLLGQGLRDTLLARPLQDLISSKSVALYWVDTSERNQIYNLSDHIGYWTISEQLEYVGGKIVPFESLVHCSQKVDGNSNLTVFSMDSAPSETTLLPHAPDLPFDSILNYLLGSEFSYHASFPQQEGTVSFMAQGTQGQWNCSVILEPLSMNQRALQHPVTITLKGTVKDWNFPKASTFSTDSWVLQLSRGQDSNEGGGLFLQLLQRLAAGHLHMVADVSTCEDFSPSTGILSPASNGVAMLTVINTAKAVGLEQLLTQQAVMDCSEDVTSDLPDIVSSVLSHVYSGLEEDLARTEDAQIPEWAQQELARTNPWSSMVVEGWYPLSNLCGASSDLMESFRLLHAVDSDENEDSCRFEMDITNNLAELYQKNSSDESGRGGRNAKRRGLPRTPVRQKMKTMSRSLQMLNVARLNVKAQKFQQDEPPQAANEKVSQKQSRRGSSNKLEEKSKPFQSSVDFKTEKELLSFINESYQKTIMDAGLSLCSCAQNMIAVIKTYIKSSNSDASELDCRQMIKSNLLKTGKEVRQQFENNQDKEAKVRECQIQTFLRLEMCHQCILMQTDTDCMELVVEEMADMLRILSLANDSASLATFLEEVLELYIASIPRVLGNLYFSLGTQIPERLASVLPSDFFSDDSMTQESKSPVLSQPPVSNGTSTTSVRDEAEQLEELRTRSAKKRRKNSLARHRSVNEASQTLRQIELPKLPKGQMKRENSHSYLAVVVEKLQMPLVPALPKKETVQEVTKVRRNLFNQEIGSAATRSAKMSRSQSVSAVEGIKHKRSLSYDSSKDHKLLTKKVTETPLHKQVSNRLLHKQMKGRCSDSASEIAVVEESPEKAVGEMNLRRSPRIKQPSISRRHSSSFYSFSQPKSRNLERLHSASQLRMNTDCAGGLSQPGVQMSKSPKRLLFGAVLGLESPQGTKRHRKDQLCSEKSIVCQTSSKTTEVCKNAVTDGSLRKSPRLSRIPCKTPRKHETIPLKTPGEKLSAAKSLGKYFSPKRGNVTPDKHERKSDRLAKVTPQQESLAMESFPTPLKIGEPHSCMESVTVFESPIRTPRKHSDEEITPTLTGTQFEVPIVLVCSQVMCTPRRKSLRTPQKPEDTISFNSPAKARTLPSNIYLGQNADKNCQGQFTPKKRSLRIPDTLETVLTASTPAKKSLLLENLSPKVLLTNLQSLCSPSRSYERAKRKPETMPALSTPVKMESNFATSPSSLLDFNLQLLCTPRKNSKPVSLELVASESPAEAAFLQVVKSPAKVVEKNLESICSPRKCSMQTPQKSATLLELSTSTKTGGLPFTKSPLDSLDLKMEGLCTPHKTFRNTPKKSEAISVTSTPLKNSKFCSVVISPVRFCTPRTFKVVSPEAPLNLPCRPLSSPLKASLRSHSSRCSPSAEVSNGLKVETTAVARNTTPRAKTRILPETSLSPLQKSPFKLENITVDSSGFIHNPISSKMCTKEQDGESVENISPSKSSGGEVISGCEKNALFLKKETLHTSESAKKSLKIDRNLSPRKELQLLETDFSLLSSSISCQLSSEVRVVCERLDTSCLTISGTSESPSTEESIDIEEAKVVATEESGLKMKLLVTRKHANPDVVKPSVAVQTGRPKDLSAPSYELRCTPDRRQREAVARFGTPESHNFSTPKSQQKCVIPGTPTYEVELEMQASGLPKLRIKRTNSSSTPEMKLLQKKTITATRKPIGDESPFSEPNSPWCGRHANKLDPACVSPCFRSSHNTPGKSGMQTYICQSYTPTRCGSNTTSPCHVDVRVPWTPSPKHKEKTTDAIKNWPRRKKAATISTNASGKNEKNQDGPKIMPMIEGEKESTVPGNTSSTKSVVLGEFEVEGVSRLQDQSPVTEMDFAAEEGIVIETFGLKSRKRRFECLSPDKLIPDPSCGSDLDRVKGSVKDTFSTAHETSESVSASKHDSSSNKDSVEQSSIEEDDVFDFKGLTPPNKIVRNSLSATGLLALTQSPLLFQGKTPSSKRKELHDEFEPDTPTEKKAALCSIADKETSPFSSNLHRRKISRTYSRKRLLS